MLDLISGIILEEISKVFMVEVLRCFDIIRHYEICVLAH